MNSVLVACQQAKVLAAFGDALRGKYKISEATKRRGALELAKRRRFDFVFMNLEMLSEDGGSDAPQEFAESIEAMASAFRGAFLIILTPQEKIRKAVRAVRAGADDFLIYPFQPQELALVLDGLAEQMRTRVELNYLRESFWKRDSRGLVRTRSAMMNKVYQKVQSVAPTVATVLLTGETGTGKSLLAKLIHAHSNRAENPFVAVHCGSLPDTLVESELFGHEKGSFTGAARRRLGKFEIADRGTIFLDEIGTISPNAQIKLLQVLQEGIFPRVGGETDIEVDVRVVAATNVDLEQRVWEGSFRRDLYYRLNVFSIELPPLRERREDISLLVRHFLDRLNHKYGKAIQGVGNRVMGAFEAYSWPGNIRELENLLERAFILETSSRLTPENFPADLMALNDAPSEVGQGTGLTLAEARNQAVGVVEKRYLVELLGEKKGRIDRCAAQAGVTPRQFRNLLAKYGLSRHDYM